MIKFNLNTGVYLSTNIFQGLMRNVERGLEILELTSKIDGKNFILKFIYVLGHIKSL